MPQLMRCQYCGILQDEPTGAKVCVKCGGELAFEAGPPPNERDSYLQVQMELDQVMAPAGRNVERHLIVTMRTPAQIPAAHQANAQAGRPPLNFAAVLDVSGSMAGEKLEQAKNALRQALARMPDGDIFSLVIFSTEVRCVVEPTALNGETRRAVKSLLDELNTQANTNLCGGLELGLKKALVRKQETNLVLVLSDGLANEGVIATDEIAPRAAAGRAQGVTISSIGVGNDYNEVLMVALADEGGGRFCHVDDPKHLAAFLTGELGDVANVAAREVEIHLDIPAGAVLMPLVAAYSIQQDARMATVRVGDIPCDTELEAPITVVLAGQPQGKLSFEGAVVYRSPADKHLKSSLNRVTLHVVEPQQFQLRAGVAAPVAERVLGHLKSSQVLKLSQTMRASPAQAEHEQQVQLDKVREYASLLGDERAAEETGNVMFEYRAMAASPAALKQSVASAHYRQRNPKQNRDKKP